MGVHDSPDISMESNMEDGSLDPKDSLLSHPDVEEDVVLLSQKDQDSWLLRSQTTRMWMVGANVSLLSTKVIFTVTEFHYPLFLLVLYLFGACIVLLVTWYRAGDSSKGKTIEIDHVPSSWRLNVRPLLASILLAVALPLLAETLIHYANLPVLMMVSLLSSVSENLFGHLLSFVKINEAQKGADESSLQQNAWICLCLGIIAFNDYRLETAGIWFAIGGFIALGASRAILKPQIPSNLWDSVLSPSIPGIKASFRLWFLPISLVFATVACLCVEDVKDAIHQLLFNRPSFLWLNLIFGIVAFSICGNQFQFPEAPCNDTNNGKLPRQMNIISILTLVLLSPWFEPRTWLSKTQIAAFAFAALLLLGLTSINISLPRQGLLGQNTQGPSRSYIKCFRQRLGEVLLSFAAVVGTTIIVSLWYQQDHVLFPRPSFPLGPPYLDKSFNATHGLDIIIAHYDEDYNMMRRELKSILAIPSLAPLQPRVHIYTKNHAVNLVTMKKITGAHGVSRIPNVGREAATYLDHIISHWDNLATHTFFMQAGLHNSGNAIQRLRNSFVPTPHYRSASEPTRSTGFLPLSFTQFCTSTKCKDQWRWTDEFGIVSELTDAVITNSVDSLLANNSVAVSAPVKRPHSILTTYQGQFIVSASRIRGIDLKIYKFLLDGLVNPSPSSWGRLANARNKKPGWESRIKSSPKTQSTKRDSRSRSREKQENTGDQDTLARPVLGYTIERMWALLFQCQNKDFVWKCPSMSGGWRSGGDVWDCQCSDDSINYGV